MDSNKCCIVDLAPYGDIQNFRLPYSHKWSSSRILTPWMFMYGSTPKVRPTDPRMKAKAVMRMFRISRYEDPNIDVAMDVCDQPGSSCHTSLKRTAETTRSSSPSAKANSIHLAGSIHIRVIPPDMRIPLRIKDFAIRISENENLSHQHCTLKALDCDGIYELQFCRIQILPPQAR